MQSLIKMITKALSEKTVVLLRFLHLSTEYDIIQYMMIEICKRNAEFAVIIMKKASPSFET